MDSLKNMGLGRRGNKLQAMKVGMSANVTLQITLELVSWKTVADVTKDRKVMKKIMKEGEGGYERPNEGAVVQVKLIGKLQDVTVFTKKGYDGASRHGVKVEAACMLPWIVMRHSNI